MITNSISIEKVKKKKFHFFTRRDLGGRNRAHFSTILPFSLYRNDKIRPKKFRIKENNLQVDIFHTKKNNTISLFVIEL